jgi:deoxyribodipyrimidine photo-lyase
MKVLNIYWSRRDFRLDDNPALYNCLKNSGEGSLFLPLFILEEYMTKGDPKYQYSYTSRVLLSKILSKFTENFEDFFVIKGKTCQVLTNLSKSYIVKVYVNDDIHPDFYKQIKKLRKAGLEVNVYEDALSVNKETKTITGNYYSIFTPFKNNVLSQFVESTITPKSNPNKDIKYLSKKEIEKIFNKKEIIKNTEKDILKEFADTRLIKVGKNTIDLDEIVERPKLDHIYTTEKEAVSIFKKYVKNDGLLNYKDKRDFLKNTNSDMAIGLAWGLISSRILSREIKSHHENIHQLGIQTYISELIWREFYKYILFHNPTVLNEEFQKRYKNKIEWRENKEALKFFKLWIQGKTGYDIVDASMREIARAGQMHNRSRMIVASILTKNLGIDWRWGQEYFRAILADLDEASNNGGWQWSASVGSDPKPIRIFNPYTQAENYDGDNVYRDKWLGKDYDIKEPIIEHKLARNEALIRYGLMNNKPKGYIDL